MLTYCSTLRLLSQFRLVSTALVTLSISEFCWLWVESYCTCGLFVVACREMLTYCSTLRFPGELRLDSAALVTLSNSEIVHRTWVIYRKQLQLLIEFSADCVNELWVTMDQLIVT